MKDGATGFWKLSFAITDIATTPARANNNSSIEKIKSNYNILTEILGYHYIIFNYGKMDKL